MTRRMLLQNSATRGHRKNMTSFFFVLKLIFNLFFDLKHLENILKHFDKTINDLKKPKSTQT
jgi:hypothetical protein